MLQKIRAKLLVVVAAAVLVAVPVAVGTGVVHAADTPPDKNAVDLQNNLGCGATFNVTPTANCAQTTTTGANKVQGVVTTILNYFSIIVGLIAGWLAGVVMKGGGYGILVDILLGIVGGLLGNWIFGRLGLSSGSGIIGSIIVSFIGAVILVAITRVLKRA